MSSSEWNAFSSTPNNFPSKRSCTLRNPSFWRALRGGQLWALRFETTFQYGCHGCFCSLVPFGGWYTLFGKRSMLIKKTKTGITKHSGIFRVATFDIISYFGLFRYLHIYTSVNLRYGSSGGRLRPFFCLFGAQSLYFYISNHWMGPMDAKGVITIKLIWNQTKVWTHP